MTKDKEQSEDTEKSKEEVKGKQEAPSKTPPAPGKPASKGEKKPPSKFSRFIRRMLWRLAIAVLLFGAGMAVTYYYFQQPRVNELTSEVDQLQEENLELQSQMMDLQTQVADLSPLAEENQMLEQDLSEAELHVQILSALKDVQSAEVALAEEQFDAARLALTRTGDKLEDLRSMLPTDNQGVVDDMVQRLELTFEGLDGDAVAAAADLSVLSNSLMSLENTLFTDP